MSSSYVNSHTIKHNKISITSSKLVITHHKNLTDFTIGLKYLFQSTKLRLDSNTNTKGLVSIHLSFWYTLSRFL